MDIIKAGWLYRRTTILKNWKREWFVLTDHGCLQRMASPGKQYDKADDVFHLSQLREMRIGSEKVSSNIKPPTGSIREQLMELVPSNGDTWTLCAESTDDLLVWQMSLGDVYQLYLERMHQEQIEWTNAQIASSKSDLAYYQGLRDADYPNRTYRAEDGSKHTVIFVDPYLRDGKHNDKHDEKQTDKCGDIKEVAATGKDAESFMNWSFSLFPVYPTMWL